LLSEADDGLVDSANKIGISSERVHFCRICGAAGKPLYNNLSDSVFAAPGTWALSKCSRQECGMLWLDPMPLVSDLAIAYQEYYTHSNRETSNLRTFAKGVYRFLVEVLLFFVTVPGERARAKRMFIDREVPGRLLDVGCGRGDFLHTMAKRGWDVHGVDFDRAAAMAAKALYGLDVRVGTLNDVVSSGDRFDVVTASHVLEHVPDPSEFLSQCRLLLKSGGMLILKTPNVGSFGHKLYANCWRGLEPPRHLHLFTINALNMCAAGAGFASVRSFTTATGAEQILIASHYIKRRGGFRPETFGLLTAIVSRLLAPLLAIRAQIEWLINRETGEEICTILIADAPSAKV
jgi:2-polyprenyl-3-methyl-5-hydroxy-6-metoxy-1,4-benzoquinol methylase